MPRKTTTTAAAPEAPPTAPATPAAAPAATPAAPLGKSATTHLFARTKEERRSALTHEQIENDLAAFARSGGEIEVLGTTFTFKSIGANKPSASPKPTTPAEPQTTAKPQE
jgi:hypothetical protein